jgi:hypothetical protein
LNCSPTTLTIATVAALVSAAGMFWVIVRDQMFGGHYVEALSFAAVPAVVSFLLTLVILSAVYPDLGKTRPSMPDRLDEGRSDEN